MDICQEKVLHHQNVQKALASIPTQATLNALTEKFKALSDPGRLKIVLALATGELCVCDLAAVTGSSDSAVSHQLRILRNLKIVDFRRQGKIVYYRLDDDHIHTLVHQSMAHVAED